MPLIDRFTRAAALTLLCLWAPTVLAQIVSPISQSRLAPIPDQAAAKADLKPIELGQTQIDFSVMTPVQRAELLRVLADPPADLSLRAWDGKGSSESADALQIQRERVAVDPSQTDGIWWFEYVNDGRSARRARWQISRLPFPQDLNSWRAPAGLVSQGEIPNVLRGKQANRFKLQIGTFLIGVDQTKLDLLNSPGQTVTSMLHSEFPASRLYLRVLALGRSGTPVTWPSNSVIIEVATSTAKSESVQALPQIIGTPALSPASAVAADFRCHFIATRPFVLPTASAKGELKPGAELDLQTGQSVNACALPPQGLLGDFEKHQGSAAYIDTLIHVWDSDRYERARDEVYDTVFRNFGGPEGGCNSHCRQALSLALDRGVAALGVPRGSSLPDPHINIGLEYLRLLLIDALRVSDLPAIVHEQASAAAVKTFRDAMLSPSHAAPPPFEPDPEFAGAAPRLTLTLVAGDVETTATYLQIRDTSRSPRIHNSIIPIPTIAAGKQIAVPIKLNATDVPDSGTSSTLAPINSLTDGLSDASELLQRADGQMREATKRQATQRKQASRGNYDLELSWRNATGEVIQAMRLRCKAKSGDCRIR